jgi:hypothetical protein
MALNHPNEVLAIHMNMFLALPPNAAKSPEKFLRFEHGQYSDQEKKNLERTEWFATAEVRPAEKAQEFSFANGLRCISVDISVSRRQSL